MRASEQGVVFTRNEYNESKEYTYIKEGALEDIAFSLGYDGISEYNEACRVEPWEVNRRLQALEGE